VKLQMLRPTDRFSIVTYADDEANEAQTRNVIVDRAVAELEHAQASTEALELNRAGRFGAARVRLRVSAEAIAQSGGGDAAIQAVVDRMNQEADACAAPMTVGEMKAQHFASSNLSKMRSSAGGARRGKSSDEVSN
jgi:hypothetical protein